ncbi:MAG: PDZ domain-containing protein [Candidatus Acidiferrales bacterium]
MRTERTRGWTYAALISLVGVLAAIPGIGFGQSNTAPASPAPAAPPPTARPAVPSALSFVQFDGSGNVAQIPFELSGNEILIPIHINRLQPSLFMVDSREKLSAIDTEHAAELHLNDAQPAASGGDAKILEPVLRVPGLQMIPRSLDVTSLHGISAQQGRPIQGRVGSDILNSFVVEVNYDRSTIQLHDPATYQYDRKGAALPLSYIDDLPVIKATATVSGRNHDQQFLIDTGFGGAVLFWKRLGPRNVQLYRHVKTRPSPIPLPDGSGPSTLQGRIKILKIGAFPFEKPIADFSLTDSGVPSHPEIAGAIGNEILRRFVVIFDMPHHRLILEPARQWAQEVDTDMSGMSVIGEGPSERTIRVVSVQEKTPAKLAGIQKGDTIVGVEAQPAVELRLTELRSLLQQPVRQCRLTLDRNGKTIEVKLLTRRLL